jgi:hypothetical protein
MKPGQKLSRKAPCHCGSGKQYKSCCYAKDRAKSAARRSLYYFPVIHGDWNSESEQMAGYWSEIEAEIDKLGLGFNKLYVSSNGGIPVFPRDGMLLRMSKEKAAEQIAGPIFKTLANLGASNPGLRWMPCENPELLEQYRKFQVEMLEKYGSEIISEEDKSIAIDLIELRDRYIADYIKNDLKNGEIGLLFLGILHREYSLKDKNRFNLVNFLADEEIEVEVINIST